MICENICDQYPFFVIETLKWYLFKYYLTGSESAFATKTDVGEIIGRLEMVLQGFDGMQHKWHEFSERLSKIQHIVSLLYEKKY